MEDKRTMNDLYQLQALPLNLKIAMTKSRIRAWVNEFGVDGVYVSFSGGKDSTVLLHIARQMYPDIKAVFVDTGLEYPEIRRFVKTFDNVDWVRPKMGFKQVCEKYGFPIISKEVSECVYGARKYLTKLLEENPYLNERTNERTIPYAWCMADLLGINRRKENKESPDYQNLMMGTIPSNAEILKKHHIDALRGGITTSVSMKQRDCLELTDQLTRGCSQTLEKSQSTPSTSMMERSAETGTHHGDSVHYVESLQLKTSLIKDFEKTIDNQRIQILMGILTRNGNATKESIPSKNRKSMFSKERWQFFLDAPFEISNRCCSVMKKEPAKRYAKETGRMPITAQMASESRLRTQKWLKKGCNAFNLKNPISNPMSFWTEQDVLLYIKTYNIPLASVYGDIVVDYQAMGQCEGQMSFSDFVDMEEFDLEKPLLKTTGCRRTGCVLCAYGCHLEKGESRFERLKKTHPKHYALLDKLKNSGVTYKEAIDWINEHNGKGTIIRY